MRDLTPRQYALLSLTIDFTKRNGYQPSMKQMAELIGRASANSVQQHIEALTKKGYIEKQEGGRALKFIKAEHGNPFRGFEWR